MELFDYKDYIVVNGFVPEDKAEYYVNWVKNYLRMKISDKISEQDRIQQYRAALQCDENRKDWQIDQAVHAVELYLNMFLKSGDAQLKLMDAFPDAKQLFGKFKDIIRLKHYAYRTEQTYLDWIRRYLEYCLSNRYDYSEGTTVKQFLTYLATRREVAASTQNQAFNSLLFFFRYVLEKKLDDIKGTVRAKTKRNIPVVLSVDEIKSLFEQLEGTRRMILELIYGCGLRISELVRLRVQDLDFENGVLRIIDAKGGKDRAVALPQKLLKPLEEHLEKVKELHESDLAIECGEVYLPPSVANKHPNAAKEWKWQYVFPSKNISVDPRTGKRRRHHILDKSIQDSMKKAVKSAGIVKNATVHTLRHSFATHLLMNGVNIREIQELLGHKNVETTMIYTHVVKELSSAPQSPLDLL